MLGWIPLSINLLLRDGIHSTSSKTIINKTGTSQVGAISKAQIKSKRGPFGYKKKFEKSRTMPKKLNGGPFSPVRFCRLRLKSKKKQQKIERGTLWGKKFPKSRSSEKNWKGGPFGLARYGMLRGKTGKTFLVQFARRNSAFWCNNIL